MHLRSSVFCLALVPVGALSCGGRVQEGSEIRGQGGHGDGVGVPPEEPPAGSGGHTGCFAGEPGCHPTESESEILHVDCGRTDSGDGSSWAKAFRSPQEAANVAKEGAEIWIKVGTCRALSSQKSVIDLRRSAVVRGGFAGTELTLENRIRSDITILSGDFLEDDEDGTEDFFAENPTRVDNSNHVVQAIGAKSVTLEALSVRSGYAVDANEGGGFWVDGAALVHVQNCDFQENQAMNGGAVSAREGVLTVENSTFSGNFARNYGGSIHHNGSSLQVIDSAFNGESAPLGASIGLHDDTPEARIENSSFQRGRALGNGGAIYNNQSQMQIADSNFIENAAPLGGAIAGRLGSLQITGSFFASNSAQGGGGAIAQVDNATELLIDSSVFINNSSQDGGAIAGYNVPTFISKSSFTGNKATYGGAIRAYAGAEIVDSEFRENQAEFVDGVGTFAVSLLMSNCSLVGNQAGEGSAVLQMQGEGLAQVIGCRVFENSSPGRLFSSVLGANLRVENTSLFNALPFTTFFTSGGATAELNHSCTSGSTVTLGSSNALLSASPFASSPLGSDPLQTAGNPCEDLGDDTLASYLNFAVEDSRVSEAGPDTDAIDAGLHFPNGGVRILQFSQDGSDFVFTSENAEKCWIYTDSSGHRGQVTNPSSGRYEHMSPQGALAFLYCRDNLNQVRSMKLVVE